MPPATRTRVTAAAIARQCGVAQQTVSRILGGQAHRHRPETVALVERTAARFGYRPHANARAMRSGRTGNLALVQDADTQRSGPAPELLFHLLGGCDQRGLGLTLARFGPQDEGTAVPRVLREVLADGLLLDLHREPRPDLDLLLTRHRIPCVWINNPRATDAVRPDDHGATLLLVRELLARGRQRIAYASAAWHKRWLHHSVGDRLAGYRQAMAEAGLEPRVLELANRDPGMRAQVLAQALTGPDRIDACLAYGEGETLMTMQAAWELGLRPDDLAWAMVAPPRRLENLPIFAAELPHQAMADAALDLLLARIEDPGRELPSRILPCSLRLPPAQRLPQRS